MVSTWLICGPLNLYMFIYYYTQKFEWIMT